MSGEIIAKNAESEMAYDLRNMNLDYADKNNVTSLFISEGIIHPYPAKAVPDMVHDLMCKLKGMYDIKTVLDPFVGSGTVALESKILGLDFYGSDLNPLAVLLARTKSLTIKNTPYIRTKLDEFISNLNKIEENEILYVIEDFKNIDYWFKEENIKQLSYIKRCIDIFLKNSSNRYKKALSLIVLTAFSATVRESSLTRNDEFKLYRLSPADVDKFEANSREIFAGRIKKLLGMIQDVNAVFEKDTVSEIFLSNAKDMSYMENVKVDLILTSPPYGDSSSTVAYGQFSKLSVQWMADLMKKYLKIDMVSENCDEYLLGGRHSVSTYKDKCFNEIINYSKTLSQLMDDARRLIKEEVGELRLASERLLQFQKQLFNSKILLEDPILSNIIRERIRLYVYRNINKDIKMSKKQIKSLTINETNSIISDLMNKSSDKYNKRVELVQTLLPKITETINRKIHYLPKREKEVLHFFVDIYQVLQESNKVISDEGIQVWIVGHRTVLGNIEVKMVDILLEWFEHMGYTKVALIKRNYHFKRLPHHINSTVTRTKEVKTMMEEHILIVKKSIITD